MKLKIIGIFKAAIILVLFALTSVTLHAGEIDTTKVKFILDGKRVSPNLIEIGQEKGNVEFVVGANTPREALFYLGEDYRYGAYIYQTIESVFCEHAHYKINGRISDKDNGKYIMLFKLRNDTIFSVDTTTVYNGTFQFQGSEYLDGIAMITCGNYPEKVKTVEVFLERGVININMDSLNVTGTPLNILYDTYSVIKDQLNVKMDSIYAVDKNQAMVMGSELNNLYKKSALYTKEFIIDNIENPVGIRVFYNELRGIYYTDFEEIIKILPKNILSEAQVVAEIKRRKEEKEKYDKRESLVGSNYYDFDLITPDNEKRKLSDYVGKSKYVFLDFWASWCSPCIADIPELKKAYDKYREEGLEIISISLDTNIESWQKTIHRVDAPWIHLSDLKGYTSQLTKDYNVNMIPMAFLIDQSGTIIEVNLRGISLCVVLERLLK